MPVSHAMMPPRHVAVIDIGKTNAKLALVDMASLTEIDVVTRPNMVSQAAPWPHYDIEGHWNFLLENLRLFHSRHGIDAISVTTHGACAVLLDANGELAAPVLDYEHSGPDQLAQEYDQLRPDFSETGSPRLPAGLNLGAQLHWQFSVDAGLHQRSKTILTYPQYWSYRLTGVAATDVSSLGCHSDLWNPFKQQFSSLVDKLAIAERIAPAYHSGDILGPVLPTIAEYTGLHQDTPVVCGIHDSNASLYPYIISREAPFSVVSTGTWVIAMAIGGEPRVLDPTRDTLVNVDARSKPVPSARFMGGREFEIVNAGSTTQPSAQQCQTVLQQQIMLLPAVEPSCGPYTGQQSRWLGAEPSVGSGERSAALAFYLALVTSQCLGMIGCSGTIIVEGSFARNHEYLEMLAAATSLPVLAASGRTGTSIGAAMLFPGDWSTDMAMQPISPLKAADDYILQWREHAERIQHG